MKMNLSHQQAFGHFTLRSTHTAALLSVFLGTMVYTHSAAEADAGGNICLRGAANLYSACRSDVKNDFYTGRTICLNISDDQDRKDCLLGNRDTRSEGNTECREIRSARRQLCDSIGGEAYDPPFGNDFAANFVDPLQIGTGIAPNTYLPLVPGSVWTYESSFLDDEGETVTETIEVSVTSETKQIEGITCVTVRDVVREDGVLIEDTDDWFAQDIVGNVWYCGEIAENFETFDGDDPDLPELVDIDGSWKSGRDGGLAGILIPAAPISGEVIRQEVAWREAEDVIEIQSLTGTESTPGGGCTGNCMVTVDFTPLDPGVEEQKFYAPDIGLILEVDDEGNRVELISYSRP